MSGHSKWHNIQKTKGAADAKRSQIFTKIAREMIVAVKTGGSGVQAAFEAVSVTTGEENDYYIEISGDGLEEGMEVRSSANAEEAEVGGGSSGADGAAGGMGGFAVMGGAMAMPDGGGAPGGGGGGPMGG